MAQNKNKPNAPKASAPVAEATQEKATTLPNPDQEIFATNPQLDVVYKTSDGKYFYTQHLAQSYANGLKNKEVIKLNR